MGAYLPKDRFEEDLILNGRDLIKHTKMDAIKKKMQAMKLEKDNAMDRADACEQQAKDANLRAERAEEEVRELQKKMQQSRKLLLCAPVQRMVLQNNLSKQFATFKTANHVVKEKKCQDYQDDASSCPALTYICIMTFFSGIVFLNLQDQYKKSHA